MRSCKRARSRGRAIASSLAATVLSGLLAPPGLLAQSGPDFLFQHPRFTLGLRVGYAVPRAGSDVFDYTRDLLTIEKGDFDAATFGVELAIRAHDQVDVALAFQLAESEKRSEFREFIGADDLPIQQSVMLSRRPLTAGLKLFPLERGRSVGRFVWIPAAWSPFVGVGGGVMWYTFQQDGEFIDFQTDDLEIFEDTIRSKDVTPTWHVMGGVDVALGPRFLTTVEGRYTWGSTGLDSAFEGFEDIDLAGFQATVGIGVRF